MGSDDNITEETFEHLAGDLGKSVQDVKLMVFHQLEEKQAGKSVEMEPHLVELFNKAAKSWGQSVEEAQKNTFRLLRKQLGS